jgi:uncharacterized protein VirK/YbjX
MTPGARRPEEMLAAWDSLRAVASQVHRMGIVSAFRSIQVAAPLLHSFPEHLNLLRVLSHPQTSEIARKQPLLAFKYLVDYVALELPVKTRRSILVSHFRFLQRTFNTSFVDSVDRLSPMLWRSASGETRFDIAMQLNKIGREGELALTFNIDGTEAYRLVFVCASGREFGLPDEPIIIVSCIQGVGGFQCIRLATKTCHDIQPAYMLMAALGGFADVARVSTILGVHQTRQLWRSDKLFFSYQQFFETYGHEIPELKMYRIRVPYLEKPLAEIAANHRARNLRKRQFKANIHDQVVQAVSEYLH